SLALKFVKDFVSQRFVLGALAPRGWRIDMAQCYERLDRGRERGRRLGMFAEAHYDERRNDLAAQANRLRNSWPTVLGVVDLSQICSELGIIVVVRDVRGCYAEMVVRGRDARRPFDRRNCCDSGRTVGVAVRRYDEPHGLHDPLRSD